MKKNRQTKIMVIVALCVAVVCLTLGFAAFSNSLTISTSANVTPNESDFKIEVLGLKNKIENDNYRTLHDELASLSLYDSVNNIGEPIVSSGVKSAETSQIDNDALTISNLSMAFGEPGQSVTYYYVMKNVSQYDAYLDVASISLPSPTCTATVTENPADQADPNLVSQACQGITINGGFGFLDSTGTKIDVEMNNYIDENGFIKIPAGEYMYAMLLFDYNVDAVRADGPFKAAFADVELKFSTTNTR